MNADSIADLLAKHEWHKYGVPSRPPVWYPMCACGESFRNLRYDQAFDAHRAHVAQVLAAAFETELADAKCSWGPVCFGRIRAAEDDPDFQGWWLDDDRETTE